MNSMQQAMANKQMEVEMRMQEAQFVRQLQMLEKENELGIGQGFMNADMGMPSHSAATKDSKDLGGSSAVSKSQSNKAQGRDKSGKFAKKD